MQESSEAGLTNNFNHAPNRVTPPRDFSDALDFDLLAEYLLDDVNVPPPSIHDSSFSLSQNSNGAFTVGSGYGNGNIMSGLVSGGSTPPIEDQYNHDHLPLLSATGADPLVDGTVRINTGHNVTNDLEHVQQLIVHQANAQASVSSSNDLKSHMPEMDYKNYQNKNALPHPSAPLNQHLSSGADTTFYGAVPVPNNVPSNQESLTAQNPNKRQRTNPKNISKAPTPGLASNNAISSSSFNIQSNETSNNSNITPMQRQKQKSQAQIDRRRERNRILARRTRLRKKFFFESLQKEVMDLQKENAALRNIVRTSIPDTSQVKSILEKCKKAELPSIVTEELGMTDSLDQQDFCLVRSLKTSQQCFVITDPSLQDNPIVYASDDFLTLTGYTREAVLGRNCRFLQGTDTDKSKVDKIRKAVAEGEDVSVCFINYTADGTAFWNQLFIAALRDTQNNIVNFIGVIVKVSGPGPDDPEGNKVLSNVANNETDDQNAPTEDIFNEDDGSDFQDIDAVIAAAEGTVKAIEGAVSAAVAAAPHVAGIGEQSTSSNSIDDV